MMRRLFILLFLIALGAGGGIAHAQKTTSAPDKTRILIILDCSQSMWDRWQSNTKIKITQQVLLRCLDSLQQQPNIEVALRVFGHLNKESFASRLEVPFEANNYHKLQDKIKTLVPNGGVTAASALTSALNDFPADNHARNIILVITDGLTDSEDNICDIAQQLQLAGTVAQTFITGIGSPDNFPHRPDCSVQFAQLPNEEPFYENLQHIFLLSDQKAQLTIALLDSEKKPYETDVPVVFYDSHTLTPRYTTLYHYGTTDPIDTLVVDPFTNYNITFFTNPPIRLNNRHFAHGLNRLEISAPQGSLRLHLENKRTAFPMPAYTVVVRRHGESEIIAQQPLNAKRSYLSGQYDIDILSLPPIHLRNIKIQSGADTDLQIPLPGQLALDKSNTPSTGSIFACQPDGLQHVCDLDPASNNERIVLMPGEYQIILRPLDQTRHTAVRTAHFTIRSAQQTGVSFK
jgi:Ca-activated chloride channel family protein